MYTHVYNIYIYIYIYIYICTSTLILSGAACLYKFTDDASVCKVLANHLAILVCVYIYIYREREREKGCIKYIPIYVIMLGAD